MRRDGDTLVFTGVLSRDQVPALWQQALVPGTAVARLDLTAVERVDSAGLAMLSALAGAGRPVVTTGTPAGLADLCVAYRLDDALAFAA